MAVPGRKPNENSVNRNKPRAGVRSYENVLFAGPWPVDLPATRTVVTRDGQEIVPLQPATRRWWEEVKRLPHAVDWDEATWGVYVDVATNVVDSANCGIATAFAHQRAWETQEILKTAESRRAAGVVYFDSEPESGGPAAVTDISSSRTRELDDA